MCLPRPCSTAVTVLALPSILSSVIHDLQRQTQIVAAVLHNCWRMVSGLAACSGSIVIYSSYEDEDIVPAGLPYYLDTDPETEEDRKP